MRQNRRAMTGRTYTHPNGGEPLLVCMVARFVDGELVSVDTMYGETGR